jgi:hypothetical protein
MFSKEKKRRLSLGSVILRSYITDKYPFGRRKVIH